MFFSNNSSRDVIILFCINRNSETLTHPHQGMKTIRTSSSSSALTPVLSPPAGQCTWVWLWAWGRSPSSCASQVLLCSGDTWGGGRTRPWQTAAPSRSRRAKRRTAPCSASGSFWPPTAVATARLACNVSRKGEALDAHTHTHTTGTVCFMALRFNVFLMYRITWESWECFVMKT